MNLMKHIMILGGGYDGVSAAVRLRGIKAAVTLVNHHSYQHLTTLLHQPVVGRREYRDLSLPLHDVLPRPVRFQRGKVLKIVPQENRIEIQTREGRAIVNEFLQPRGYDNIFVLGDCAAATGGDGTFLPPTAQLAVQQGDRVARAPNSLIRGDKMEPYHPRMEGILLSIGRSHALGIVRCHHVTGRLAGMLKDFIAYRHIYKIGGLSLALRKFREWRSYSALLRRL